MAARRPGHANAFLGRDQDRDHLWAIAPLPWRDQQGQRPQPALTGQMDFRRQPASRTAEGFVWTVLGCPDALAGLSWRLLACADRVLVSTAHGAARRGRRDQGLGPTGGVAVWSISWRPRSKHGPSPSSPWRRSHSSTMSPHAPASPHGPCARPGCLRRRSLRPFSPPRRRSRRVRLVVAGLRPMPFCRWHPVSGGCAAPGSGLGQVGWGRPKSRS